MTNLPVAVFAQSDLPQHVLPVPAAIPAARDFSRDATQMEQDSLGFVHGSILSSRYLALDVPSERRG
jgi:hypothetical protein